jgi:acetyl-CoA acetyltransferase
MRQAAVVSAVRLPVGRAGGALSGFRPEKLGRMILREAVKEPLNKFVGWRVIVIS